MKKMRWINRPDGSNWGDFGVDDQLGCLNYLTAQKVLEGVKEVQEGLNFCLSLPLDYPGGSGLNPNRKPPILRPTLRQNNRVNFNFPLKDIDASKTDVVSDDLVILHLQYSTQWDSLAHVGSHFDADGDGIEEAIYYNGYSAKDHFPVTEALKECGIPLEAIEKSSSNALALGIENMAEKSIQGRAVMLDLFAHFGEERVLVGYDALMNILQHDRITIEAGDILCLHTGFAENLYRLDKNPDENSLHNYGAVLNGRDPQLLQWITNCKIAALVADNYSVEAYPAKQTEEDCCAALPLHEHCLFKLGLPLGELWRLTPLADWLKEHNRYRFFLTASPLNLPGAVGSPVTPVGTV